MSDEIRYDGRVAVITGAGGGLGKTYALELGRRGAQVVVNDLGGSSDGTGGVSTLADSCASSLGRPVSSASMSRLTSPLFWAISPSRHHQSRPQRS